MGTATAEPRPEDPYVEQPAPQPRAAKKAAAIEPAAEIDWEATWDAYGYYAIGGLALLVVMFAIKRRRARRMRKLLENRRTQFGFAAIDPAVIEQHRAAWECAPLVTPAAIDPSPIAPSVIAPMPPRRARMAQGSQQPPIAGAVLTGPPQMPALPPSAMVPRPLPPLPGLPPMMSPNACAMPPMPSPTMSPNARAMPPMPPSMGPTMVAAVAPRPAAMVMHPFAVGSEVIAHSVAQPGYPLTFAASQLLARRTARGHAVVNANAPQAWDDARTQTDDDDPKGDFTINFARGSQDEELERASASLRETFVVPAKRR